MTANNNVCEAMITLLAVNPILRLNSHFQIASRWSCGAPLPIAQPVLLYLGSNPDPAWNDTENRERRHDNREP